MSVSPADFELYSRVTGTPYPRSAAEQMQLAPHVHNFIRNRGYQGPVQQTAQGLSNVLGGVRNIGLLGALAGAGALAYANREKKVDGGDDGGGGAAVPGPQNDLSGGGSGLPQGPYQAPNPAATFQDYQDLRRQPGGPLTRQGGDVEEVNVQVDPQTPREKAELAAQNILSGAANSVQGLLNPGARGGDIVSTPSSQIQPNLPASSSGGALDTVQSGESSDLATSGGGYLSKIRSNPYQSTGKVYETDNSWVNPLNRLNQGQFLRKNPRTVTDPQTGEDVLINPASTGRSEVPLGLGVSGFRPGMRNLPSKLGMIWAKPNLLPEGHHSLIGDAVSGALTGVTDLVAPEVGVPLHVAKFAMGGLGQAANLGMRGIESAGAIVPAIAEHALLDSADLARMVGQPAVAGLRTAASYAPGIVKKGIQDMDVTGREVARTIPILYGKAAERGGEDYQRGVIKPAIEYMGERAGSDLGRVKKWEQATRTAAAAKAISAISKLADHPQEPDVPGGENKVVPTRDPEQYDDRYPGRHEEDDHIDGFADPRKLDPWS